MVCIIFPSTKKPRLKEMKEKTKSKIGLALFSILLLSMFVAIVPVAAVNLGISNAGFETGDFTD